jgi:hypothetical protein
MTAAPGEPESRRARAETLVERAAGEGAALVALREMFAPGYLASREVWDLAEPLDRGPTVAWLQRTARRFGIHVAGGLGETDERDFFDTFVVCMPRERFQSDTFDQSATKRKISFRDDACSHRLHKPVRFDTGHRDADSGHDPRPWQRGRCSLGRRDLRL